MSVCLLAGCLAVLDTRCWHLLNLFACSVAHLSLRLLIWLLAGTRLLAGTHLSRPACCATSLCAWQAPRRCTQALHGVTSHRTSFWTCAAFQVCAIWSANGHRRKPLAPPTPPGGACHATPSDRMLYLSVLKTVRNRLDFGISPTMPLNL